MMIEPSVRGQNLRTELYFSGQRTFQQILEVEEMQGPPGRAPAVAPLRFIERVEQEVAAAAPEATVRVRADHRFVDAQIAMAGGGEPLDVLQVFVHLLDDAGRAFALAEGARLVLKLSSALKKFSDEVYVSDGLAVILAADRLAQSGHGDLTFLFVNEIHAGAHLWERGGFLVAFHDDQELHQLIVNPEGHVVDLPSTPLPSGVGSRWQFSTEWDEVARAKTGKKRKKGKRSG